MAVVTSSRAVGYALVVLGVGLLATGLGLALAGPQKAAALRRDPLHRTGTLLARDECYIGRAVVALLRDRSTDPLICGPASCANDAAARGVSFVYSSTRRPLFGYSVSAVLGAPGATGYTLYLLEWTSDDWLYRRFRPRMTIKACDSITEREPCTSEDSICFACLGERRPVELCEALPPLLLELALNGDL